MIILGGKEEGWPRLRWASLKHPRPPTARRSLYLPRLCGPPGLPPLPSTLAPTKVLNVFGGKSLVLPPVKVDPVLKIDLSNVWPAPFSTEDILLTEKKGGEQWGGFFLKVALTALGNHWDFLSFFVLYLYKPLQRAFGGEKGMRGWPPGLVEKGGGGWGCLCVSYDQTPPCHPCSEDLGLSSPRWLKGQL